MDKNICVLERQFISYLTKWLIGERIKYIEKDIKRNTELIEHPESQLYIDLLQELDNWTELIENKALYYYINSLDSKNKNIIYRNIILGDKLTTVANELGISKQLANFYKQQFLKNAKKILLNDIKKFL